MRVNVRTRTCVVLFASLGAAVTGCVDVNGGAVEVSWSLQKQSGEPNACGPAEVAQMSLVATPVLSGAGLETRIYRWPCDRYHGTTRFDLAPGRYQLELVPECASTAFQVLPTVRVPAPIVRDIQEGAVVSLDAFLIVAGSSELVCGMNTPTARRLSEDEGEGLKF